MPRHSEKTPADAELLQGTLDMLILKVAALRPIHGYAIVQRIQQISQDAWRPRGPRAWPAQRPTRAPAASSAPWSWPRMNVATRDLSDGSITPCATFVTPHAPSVEARDLPLP